MNHFWLKNAHIPVSLLENLHFQAETREGLVLVDMEVTNGQINSITTPTTADTSSTPFWDLQRSIVFPCFVDMHTHLDKGHIWERSPNLLGTFAGALTTIRQDAERFWSEEDVYRRMEFGLKCSYAHGTMALRTHLDSFGEQGEISLRVFKTLQKAWSDKISLQAVPLVPLDYYQTPPGIELANSYADVGSVLGGVVYINPNLDRELEQVLEIATERNMDLDLHVDENGDISSICLEKIAQAALKNEFRGKIICGHCCSLSVQPPEVVKKTLALVKEARIGIVSLPMCNLFLQDRYGDKTPFWRGVTQVHELKGAGIPVAFASDNCRDPFYGFGDHDMLEVFSQSVRICHLDTPYQDWCHSFTKTPATLMGLHDIGKIAISKSADLVIFSARYFSELLARPQSDRQVMRRGKFINTQLPDYRELDDLLYCDHTGV